MKKGPCIYCSTNKQANKPYSREHVLPEAFGKYKNNLVLNEGVCSDCNKYFGQTIDRILARGTLEAISRLDYKIKRSEDSHEILMDRVGLTLSTNNKFNGLILEYGDYEGQLVVTLVPQVGFRKNFDDGLVYISEHDLRDTSKPLPNNIDKNKCIVFFNSHQMRERLIRLLSDRGITLPMISEEKPVGESDGEESLIEIKTMIDNMVYRCIAKISFNYLAKIIGIDFANKSIFNPIREYIRWGKTPDYKIIKISNNPILHYDSIKFRQTNGHLVTIDWALNNHSLVGNVSLFNRITYKVLLLSNFSGIWRPIRSGHHYDIEAFEVKPLLGLSKRIM